MNLKEKVRALLYAIILIVLLGVLFQWPDTITAKLIDWVAAIIVSVICTAICSQLLEKFTGNTFKQILLDIPVGEYHFSVSLFFILTIALKLLLF